MSVSDYGAQQWAGIMFGIAAVPATFYVALCTDEPGTGWDGSVVATVEPVDAAYARQPYATSGGWVLGENNFVFNASAIPFPTPAADWGQITHYALLDAATAGNLWLVGRFLDPQYVYAGAPLSLDVGSLSVGVGNQLPSIAE